MCHREERRVTRERAEAADATATGPRPRRPSPTPPYGTANSPASTRAAEETAPRPRRRKDSRERARQAPIPRTVQSGSSNSTISRSVTTAINTSGALSSLVPDRDPHPPRRPTRPGRHGPPHGQVPVVVDIAQRPEDGRHRLTGLVPEHRRVHGDAPRRPQRRDSSAARSRALRSPSTSLRSTPHRRRRRATCSPRAWPTRSPPLGPRPAPGERLPLRLRRPGLARPAQAARQCRQPPGPGRTRRTGASQHAPVRRAVDPIPCSTVQRRALSESVGHSRSRRRALRLSGGLLVHASAASAFSAVVPRRAYRSARTGNHGRGPRDGTYPPGAVCRPRWGSPRGSEW